MKLYLVVIEDQKESYEDATADVGERAYTNLADAKQEFNKRMLSIENDEDKWCLIVDRFATHKGYLPMVTDDLASGEFKVLSDEEFDLGVTLKRHGGIMNLTEEEYQVLSQFI